MIFQVAFQMKSSYSMIQLSAFSFPMVCKGSGTSTVFLMQTVAHVQSELLTVPLSLTRKQAATSPKVTV